MIGDVIFQSVKIGSLDLLNGEASFNGIRIYESIDDPFGSPLIEIDLVDPSDATKNITGDFEKNKCEIKFKYEPTGEVVGFSGVMHSSDNVQDNSGNKNQGSSSSKLSTIKFNQAELNHANRNPVRETFNGPTTKHVEKIFKDYCKTDKQVESRGGATEKRDIVHSTVVPIDAVQKTIYEHTNPKHKGLYFCFQEWSNGKGKIVQAPASYLLDQQPVVTLKERTDLRYTGATEQDEQNSIIASEAFPADVLPRAACRAVKQSVNLSTHVCVDEKFKDDTRTKKPAYKQPYKDGEYVVKYTEDTINNGNKHTAADSAREKAQQASHLLQGVAKIECPGNPKIKLGSVIALDIPKKTDNKQFGGDTQVNKNCLVTAIKHNFKPSGQRPQWTMTLELVKGGMEQGGQNA